MIFGHFAKENLRPFMEEDVATESRVPADASILSWYYNYFTDIVFFHINAPGMKAENKPLSDFNETLIRDSWIP